MYEMEGASQSRGANGPIARPANPRNPPPSLGGTSANSGRLGARLPRRRLPGRPASRVNPVANSDVQVLARANSRPLVLADPEVSPGAGSPSLVACEISIAAERPAQEAGGTNFRILGDGTTHPQKRLRYPQSEPRCPPVVHQFIHTRAPTLVGTTVRRRGPRWLRQRARPSGSPELLRLAAPAGVGPVGAPTSPGTAPTPAGCTATWYWTFTPAGWVGWSIWHRPWSCTKGAEGDGRRTPRARTRQGSTSSAP